MDGYQPPLLNLQDMLNLDDDGNNDDPWSNNPFSIANFFEPISSTGGVTGGNQGRGSEKSPLSAATQSGRNVQQSYYSSFETAVNSFNPFDGLDTVLHDDAPTAFANRQQVMPSEIKNEVSTTEDPFSLTREDDPLQNHEQEDHNYSKHENFPDLDVFEEDMVNSELNAARTDNSNSSGTVENSVEEILPDLPFDDEPRKIPSPEKSKRSKSDTLGDTRKRTSKTSHVRIPPRPFDQQPGPTLQEVKLENIQREDLKAKFKRDMEVKYRKDAIEQLNSLIDTLKRYCNQLNDFLTNEGDMILEHYNAKTLLRGILPEINESRNQQHPFFEAKSVTKAIVDRVRGHTYVSKLPPRRAFPWRGSELLLLQKTILESVMHNREFLLYCRYTDLLTQMGFDSEDIERLRKCSTKEIELGTLKIILNEHNFYSKLKSAHKGAIKTIVLNKDHKGSGVPRVYVFPSPQNLVTDKWNALVDIRRRTVLSNIEDKDINWLFVLKTISERISRLNSLDEETCKLTYDHMLSPKYNKSPWHIYELQELREIRGRFPNASWEKVANLVGTNRSPFSCFVKYKTHCIVTDMPYQPPSVETVTLIKNCFEKAAGNAFKVDLMLARVLKKQYCWHRPARLLLIGQKILNPRLRKGMFSVVEDALLLVVMEKYKSYLLENDGIMDPVRYSLPWRYTTVWRLRLKTIFTQFYAFKWTLEEDKLLWSLTEEYGPNWKIIQRSFPHKNNKQCRNRYTQLQSVFQNTSLEDYHLVYFSKSGLNVSKMTKLAEYLEMTIRAKLAGFSRYVREADLEFLKLRRQPTENNLENYLISFPVGILKATLKRLVVCMQQIESRWKDIHGKESSCTENTATIPNRLKGFDRRKFDPQCPFSIGSALHLRKAKLVPQNTLANPTEFEENIYTAYKFFSVRSSVKGRTQRTSIPTLANLCQLQSITRIIERPHQKYKPGQPSVIVTIKSELLDDIEKDKQDQELLQELEEKKKGGARKGSKRKQTQMKERKKRAAMLRWQKQKSATADDGEDNKCKVCAMVKLESISHSCQADSPFWEVPSPATPATPGSIASTGTAASGTITGTGQSMRKAIVGMISDHAYIHPVESLADLSCLTLPQLFAKMGKMEKRGK